MHDQNISLFRAKRVRPKGATKTLKHIHITAIVDARNAIASDFVVSPKIIRYRERNGNLITRQHGSGQVSPFPPLEPQFVCIIIQMSRIGDPLTPEKCLSLLNDLTDGTKY